MLCSAILGVLVYRLSADMIDCLVLTRNFNRYETVLNFLLLLFWDCCLCYFVTMLCQHWIVGVVRNVLRTTYCLYVSLFLYFQGNAFQFQCMYAPPHSVKKCVVLCVRGLLCFVDSSLGPTSPDAPFRNIVQRPGVPTLFAMLLDKFHIGL